MLGGWSLGRLFVSPARVDCEVRGEPGGTLVPVNRAAGVRGAAGHDHCAVQEVDQLLHSESSSTMLDLQSGSNLTGGKDGSSEEKSGWEDGVGVDGRAKSAVDGKC